jgi:hypothetical protein
MAKVITLIYNLSKSEEGMLAILLGLNTVLKNSIKELGYSMDYNS